MTDPLPACPFCGSANLRHAMFPMQYACSDCDAAAPDWRARALGPALDVVLEAVEDHHDSGAECIWGKSTDGELRQLVRIGWTNDLLAMLRALRDARSPTDTPSGSGAESDGGEAP